MTIKELQELIIENSKLYYTTGQSNLTDNEFDYLVSMLRAYDPQNPILNETGWGYKVASQTKVKHINGKIIGIPDKITPSKVGKWSGSSVYYITPKLDGLSVISYYEEGRYVGSLTRGDGEYGQNITHHVRHMVPDKLVDENGNPITGMIRGEFIINKNKWNMKYASEFKSARNFGAGLLNRLEISPQIRDFEIVHYSVFDCYRQLNFKQQFAILAKNNINRVSFCELSDINQLNNESQCRNYLELISGGKYECDGLVVVTEDNGFKRFAIKWNGEGVKTTVRDIVWEQSRLGYYKPVVIVDPVNISGATIQRASAFNYKYVVDNKLGVGSEVAIVRSGEVIPYIVEVITESEQNNAPKICSYCGEPLKEVGVELKCCNDDCPGSQANITKYFISSTMCVDGLGENLITQFLTHFKLVTILDYLKFATDYINNPSIGLSVMRFCQTTKGLGFATYSKFDAMLNKIKSPIPLCTLISGLGLNGLGYKNTEKIFGNVKNEEELYKLLDSNTTMDIFNLSYVAMDSVRDNKQYIKDVISYFNVQYLEDIDDIQDGMLKYNIGICVTGALSMPRRVFFDKCSKLGITEVPIAKAKLLVTNNKDSGTTKNKEAVKRGIPIMSEEEFIKEYFRHD